MTQAIILTDPLCGREIEALRLHGADGLEVVCIPERALDLYSLRYAGTQISYTRHDKGIAPTNFVEDGAQGFARNFFAGFATTCGLIQSGRPCEENGRRFGLHGCISNTSAHNVHVEPSANGVIVTGVIDERHPEGEHMRLTRRLTLVGSQLEIHDHVQNVSDKETPFMMMYHMNFGAPFLSDKLRVEASFLRTEDRDTGLSEAPERILRMDKPASMTSEKVYYTQPNMRQGVTLTDPETGIACRLSFQGEGLDWMGVWKDFTADTYALGIEPCNCPGLGRVGARARGILPLLRPDESREHTITATFTKS